MAKRIRAHPSPCSLEFKCCHRNLVPPHLLNRKVFKLRHERENFRSWQEVRRNGSSVKMLILKADKMLENIESQLKYLKMSSGTKHLTKR